MSTRKTDPGGLYCYLATPFDKSGNVDLAVLKDYVQQIVEHGVAGVTCLASTCEGPYMTELERKNVLEAVSRVASGKLAVNVGIGGVSTRQAVEAAKQAKDLGATSLMLEMQQYFPVSFNAAVKHYQTVAEACDVPIRLYNLTLSTRFDFTPDRILAMSSIGQIISIKDASGDVTRLRDIRMLCGDRFTLYCGFHYQALEGFRFGAQGWEVMMHPSIAAPLVDLYRSLVDDPWSEQSSSLYRALQPLFHFFKQYGVPQSIKEISNRTSLKFGSVREPLEPLPDIAKRRLHRMMDELADRSIVSA
ncbi:dihydrodipicolinate synthase family protein [Castellaniella sp.]|uniref:dihydrodipicolinate synthase family protein n=1 Tax=Castellaniella sp. TaxID=1955812 RepID=UPI003C708B45